jgi:hypothetical protein
LKVGGVEAGTLMATRTTSYTRSAPTCRMPGRVYFFHSSSMNSVACTGKGPVWRLLSQSYLMCRELQDLDAFFRSSSICFPHAQGHSHLQRHRWDLGRQNVLNLRTKGMATRRLGKVVKLDDGQNARNLHDIVSGWAADMTPMDVHQPGVQEGVLRNLVLLLHLRDAVAAAAAAAAVVHDQRHA